MNWLLNCARPGVITNSMVLFCALMGSSLPGYSASAIESVEISPKTGKRFATVWRIHGEIVASGGGVNDGRILHEGDPVYVGEHLCAAALAEAVLKTEDAGVIAIRPNTEFIAESFAAEDKPTDSFTLRLLTGSLRVISGWIARTNRSGHKIVTPSATVGIRGTDHEPYVLSVELAKSTSNPAGTYDKVNRGGTIMQVGENTLDIDTGRVGFVRAPVKTRALMTILLPVLLDKIPNFYVPGQFDAELDNYSQTADSDSLRQLEQLRKSPSPAPYSQTPDSGRQLVQKIKTPSAATDSQAPENGRQQESNASSASHVAECPPTDIAKNWLDKLDTAIARHSAPAIIAMFAPEAEIRATVRDNEGKMVSADLGREELAQSTLAAMKGLKHFKQRRVWTKANLEGAACDRISIKSLVIEQGLQSGKSYRFESLEEYVIELRSGKWLSIKAETTQR